MPKDISLSEYMEQLVKVQANTGSISHEQLKHLAIECGFTEYEWGQLQEEAEKNYQNASGHLEFQNYSEAIRHFDKVLQINPFHTESLLGTAQAYQKQFEQQPRKTLASKARMYANRVLEIKPGDPRAISLIKQLKSGRGKVNTRVIFSVLTAISVMGIGMLFFLVPQRSPRPSPASEVQTLQSPPTGSDQNYNKIIRTREAVYRQWAQVENVLQRRSDVVNQILPLIRSSEHFEAEMIDKILLAQEAMGSEVDLKQAQSMEQYHAYDQALSQQLKQVLLVLKDPQLNSSQMYKDLQVQIERSENRISIERKRYNEAVEQYNSLIQQKPYDAFSFDTLPYFARKAQSK